MPGDGRRPLGSSMLVLDGRSLRAHSPADALSSGRTRRTAHESAVTALRSRIIAPPRPRLPVPLNSYHSLRNRLIFPRMIGSYGTLVETQRPTYAFSRGTAPVRWVK